MAMTFTIATAARDALSAVIAARQQREQEEDDAKERAYEEVGCNWGSKNTPSELAFRRLMRRGEGWLRVRWEGV